MKKIFILAYARANLGDDLFVYMLLKKYKDVQFYMNIKEDKYQKAFKNFSNITIIPEKERELTRENAKDFDGYIYMGGSIFMEGGVVYNISETFLEFLKECKKNNIPFFYISSNFGPYYTNEYLELAKRVYNQITNICFRDKYSYNMFKDINTVQYAPDLAFSYFANNNFQKSNTIGISMIDLDIRKDIKEKKNQYLKLIKKSIENYIDEGKEVYLFSFCQHEGDEKAIEELLGMIENKYITQIKKILYNGNLEEFLDIYSNMEYMLCTRFHAMILSCIFNQKSYVLSYSKKINNVIEDLKLFEKYGEFNQIDKIEKITLSDYKNVERNNLKNIIEESKMQINALNKFIYED